jgi:hypothetical protein
MARGPLTTSLQRVSWHHRRLARRAARTGARTSRSSPTTVHHGSGSSLCRGAVAYRRCIHPLESSPRADKTYHLISGSTNTEQSRPCRLFAVGHFFLAAIRAHPQMPRRRAQPHPFIGDPALRREPPVAPLCGTQNDYIETSSLEAAYDNAQQFRATALSPIHSGHGRRLFRCQDPAGNIVEVFEAK